MILKMIAQIILVAWLVHFVERDNIICFFVDFVNCWLQRNFLEIVIPLKAFFDDYAVAIDRPLCQGNTLSRSQVPARKLCVLPPEEENHIFLVIRTRGESALSRLTLT